ncbi:MAG: hypothetical protein ACJ76W_06520, partial [Chloroflexota bacterium]
DDDLDLATAVAIVREAIRAQIPDDERRWLALDADFVLGLDLDRVWAERIFDDGQMPADVAGILAERTVARAAREFTRADELRNELAARGWEVVDGPDGSTIRRTN